MYFELARVTKGQEYRWRVVTERPDGEPSWKDAVGNEFWAGETMARIAFIGYGSAVAYYLTALEQVSVSGKQTRADVYGRMTVFGAVDPWDRTVRGEGYTQPREPPGQPLGEDGPRVQQKLHAALGVRAAERRRLPDGLRPGRQARHGSGGEDRSGG